MSRREVTKAPIVREPRENMSPALVAVGLAGRWLILFLCVLGAALFITDAFGIVDPASGEGGASVAVIVVSALVFSAAAALAAYDSRAALAAPLACAAGFAGVVAAVAGNPVSAVWDGIRCTWNTAMEHLALDAHYMSFSAYRLPAGYRYDVSVLLGVGAALLCALLAALFALCLFRRAKIIPTAILCAVILVPVFTYNLTRGVAGVAFAVVFIAASLALCLFDRRYFGREFAYFARRDKRLGKKTKRSDARAKRKQKRETKKRRERAAYDSALAVTDDRSLAREAKRAVGRLEREEIAERRKAEREADRERKKAEKKAKKEAKAAAAKEKKAAIAERKKLAAAAKKDRALAERLAAERRKKLAESAAEKKKKAAERRAERRERDKKRRADVAAGGLAGLLATVIALTSVAIPAFAVSGNFPIIPFINKPVSVARAYVTAYLSGNDIDLNDLDVYGELSGLAPRKLSFDPLVFQGTQIFSVSANLTQNVYLRSWIARDFDEETQTWMGSTSDQVLDYRSEFGRDFTPDELRTRFNALVNPSSVTLVDDSMFFPRQGFAVERVDVRRINSSSKIVFTPAVMNTGYAMLKWGKTEPIDAKYSYFYDGIYSSRFFDDETPYSTVSFVTDLRDPRVADGIDDSIRYLDLAASYLAEVDSVRETVAIRGVAEGETTTVETASGRVFEVRPDDLSGIDEAFQKELADGDIGYTGDSLVARVLGDGEVYESILDYLALEEDYAAYARETYGATFGSDRVAALAESLLAENGYSKSYNRLGAFEGFVDGDDERVPDHDVIMTVIDYLRENCEYTLAPAAPEDAGGSVLDAFLFDTKQGYCTHFATAACALLRAIGYPVRFCEGYIVTDLHPNYGEKVDSKYTTFVLDENAHAWVEVYIDGYGWQQYETTPEYDAAMYDAGYEVKPVEKDPTFEEGERPESEDKPEKPQRPEPERIPIEEEEDTFDYALMFLIVGIVLASAAILYAAVRLVWGALKRRAKKASDARYAVVRSSLEEVRKFKSPEDNRALALELNDQIMSALAISGLAPEDGEGVTEFSARVAQYFEGIAETPVAGVIETMMRAEFGTGLEHGDLYVLGDFASRIVPSVYNGLTPPRKLYWRYLKRKI